MYKVATNAKLPHRLSVCVHLCLSVRLSVPLSSFGGFHRVGDCAWMVGSNVQPFPWNAIKQQAKNDWLIKNRSCSLSPLPWAPNGHSLCGVVAFRAACCRMRIHAVIEGSPPFYAIHQVRLALSATEPRVALSQDPLALDRTAKVRRYMMRRKTPWLLDTWLRLNTAF